MFKEKFDKIGTLKENCDSFAKQVGKELILERKLKIQNKIIDELKADIKVGKDKDKWMMWKN